MDIQEYKALSIKYNYGKPVTPWQLYYHTVIDTLKNSYDMQESRRAATIWKRSFQGCIDTLPRSKKFVQYYYFHDDGFFGVIITEQYVCGFEVCYSKDTAVLNYDDGSGSKVASFATFDQLCDMADMLTNDEFDIFREMSNAYQTIKDALIFYKEHITRRFGSGASYDYLCDNTVIYSGTRGLSSSKDIENWKV